MYNVKRIVLKSLYLLYHVKGMMAEQGFFFTQVLLNSALAILLLLTIESLTS